VFCEKGTALHTEQKAAWKRYIASDKAALDKYGYLFPPNHDHNMNFVVFQQALLRDYVANMATEEELAEVEEFIEKQLKEKQKLEKNPWMALRVDDTQTELDLQRQYVEM
jgi:hypothetical protein